MPTHCTIFLALGIKKEQTFCLQSGTKKEIFLLRGGEAIQKSKGYLEHFLSLLVKSELDQVCTCFRDLSLLMKSWYEGNCRDDLEGTIWETPEWTGAIS